MWMRNEALRLRSLSLIAVLTTQVFFCRHAAGHTSSPVGNVATSHTSYSTGTSSTTLSKPLYSFHTYPTAADYAAGTCAGYAFCFAAWNPPVVTEPDVMCPAGYDISSSNGAPICVQKQGVCPSGYDLSSKGDCCKVKTQNTCYADWDNCGSGSLYNIGSICSGTNDYKSIVDNVQMVQVTSGSKWFDGSMDNSAAAYAGGSSSSSSGSWPAGSTDDMGSSGMNSYGDGSVTYSSDMLSGASSSMDDGQNYDSGSVQVIPGGNLVNFNGKLVHVGPVPPGSAGPPGGNSGVKIDVDSTGGTGNSQQQQQQQQQQQALAALQQQAQQQGTYVPGGPAAPGSAPTAAGGGGGVQQPQLNGQALAALQQQAQQQGTYIPGSTAAGSSTSGARLAGGKQYSSSSSSSSKQYSSSVSSSSGSGSRLAGVSPHDGLEFMKMLLLLPKIALGNLGVKIGTEVMAKKEVMANALTTKEDLLPKCFNKCCTSKSDVACVGSTHTINYAKPAYICPPGCTFADNTNKCDCSPGHFTPCQPTDTVCSWGDQPICVGSSYFFGVEACTFVGLLQKQLPKVQCPYGDS